MHLLQLAYLTLQLSSTAHCRAWVVSSQDLMVSRSCTDGCYPVSQLSLLPCITSWGKDQNSECERKFKIWFPWKVHGKLKNPKPGHFKSGTVWMSLLCWELSTGFSFHLEQKPKSLWKSCLICWVSQLPSPPPDFISNNSPLKHSSPSTLATVNKGVLLLQGLCLCIFWCICQWSSPKDLPPKLSHFLHISS